MDLYELKLSKKHIEVIMKAIKLFCNFKEKNYSYLLDAFFPDSLNPIIRKEAEEKLTQIREMSLHFQGKLYDLFVKLNEYDKENIGKIEQNILKGNFVFSVNFVNTLLRVLELFERVGIGQYGYIMETFFGIHMKYDYRDQMEYNFEYIKNILLDLPRGASLGICGEKTPEDAKIAYEIQKTLLFKKSWHEKPEGGITVNFDEPLKITDEPLPEVLILTGEDNDGD